MSSDRFAWLPVHKLLFLVVYWSLAFLDGSKNYLVLHFINFSILKKMLLLWPTIHLQCSVAPSTGGHTETHTHTAICCWTNHELCRNIWHHLMVTSSCSSFWPTLTVFARLIATVLHEAERGLFSVIKHVDLVLKTVIGPSSRDRWLPFTLPLHQTDKRPNFITMFVFTSWTVCRPPLSWYSWRAKLPKTN